MVHTSEVKDPESKEPEKQLDFYKGAYLETLIKLKKYECLKKEGLLVILPLKVGDVVIKDNMEFKVHTLSYNVSEINLSNCNIRYCASPCNDELEEIDDIWFWGDDIGESIAGTEKYYYREGN